MPNKVAPITDEERKKMLMMAGKLSGEETPQEVDGIVASLSRGEPLIPGPMDFAFTRELVSGLTMGASTGIDRLFGVKRPDSGWAGTAGNIIGSMNPASAAGGIAKGTASLARMIPSVDRAMTAAPRIARTALGALTGAEQGAGQALLEGNPEQVGSNAAWGAGLGGAMDAGFSAIGYLYSKGLRRFASPKEATMGRVDPTLRKPFDPPNVTEWDGQNIGLKRIADQYGIPLPLLSLRPNDPFMQWVAHKTTQFNAAKGYLEEADRKLDAKLRKGLEDAIDGLSNGTYMLYPKETGDYLVHNFGQLTRELREMGSDLYNTIMGVGIQGKKLGDWGITPKAASDLVDQLNGLLRYAEGVGDKNVNKIRALINDLTPQAAVTNLAPIQKLQQQLDRATGKLTGAAPSTNLQEVRRAEQKIETLKDRMFQPHKPKLVRPTSGTPDDVSLLHDMERNLLALKERSRSFLDVNSQEYRQAQTAVDDLQRKIDVLRRQTSDVDPYTQPIISLHNLWVRGRELWPESHTGDFVGTAKKAKMLVGEFVRDMAETLNPNTRLLFDVADRNWRIASTLDESEIGKVLTGKSDDVVGDLTRDITTLNSVRDELNRGDFMRIGSQMTHGLDRRMGDKFVSELARRRLATLIDKAVDPMTKKLDVKAFSKSLEGLSGKTGSGDEYLDALLQSNPEVRTALKDIERLALAIDPARKALTPRSGQLQAGSEVSSPEELATNMQKVVTLLLRFTYGSDLGKFVSRLAPDDVNPLMGAMRPALSDATRPMGLLNALKRGAISGATNNSIFGQ